MEKMATLQMMQMVASMNMRSITLLIMGPWNVGDDGAECDADGIDNLSRVSHKFCCNRSPYCGVRKFKGRAVVADTLAFVLLGTADILYFSVAESLSARLAAYGIHAVNG